MHDDEVLAIRDLSHRYRRQGPWALRDVTLRWRPGLTGLLGPNGAGKSTLMRLLIGADAPTEGSVSWRGTELARPADWRAFHRRLGYLPQAFDVDPGARCDDALMYFAWLKEIPRAQAPSEVGRVLGLVGLGELARQRFRTLSGGMRQRLGIAQALLGSPEVILLDEPTVGLDPRQRRQVRDVLGVQAKNALVLCSTHMVEEIASLGGRAVVMSGGVALFDGTVADLAAVGGGSADSVGALERGALSFFGGED